MTGQRWEHAACRAWARRGERLCAAHGRARRSVALAMTAADAADSGRPHSELLSSGAPPARLAAVVDRLEAGADGGLDDEIAAARLTLARLLRAEADPVRLADGVAKAAGVVLKARQLERRQGEAGESLADETAQMLREMGLGES